MSSRLTWQAPGRDLTAWAEQPLIGPLTGATADAHRVGSQVDSLMSDTALHRPAALWRLAHEVLILFFAFAELGRCCAFLLRS